MVETLLLVDQKQETRRKDNSPDPKMGCGSIILAIIFVVVWLTWSYYDTDDFFLTARLNLKFGEDTTDYWENQVEAIELLESAYLLHPKATRVSLNQHPNYQKTIDVASYWAGENENHNR